MKRLRKADLFFRRTAVSLIRSTLSDRDEDFDEIALSLLESPPEEIYKVIVALCEAAAIWSGYIADSKGFEREAFVQDFEEFMRDNSKD